MISVMEDESFANIEELLDSKRKKIKSEIEDLTLKLSEIDEFIASGRDNGK